MYDMKKDWYFFPYNFVMILFFLVLLLFLPLIFLLYAGGIVAAFGKLGFNSFVGFTLFLLCIFGSAVNIPIKRIETTVPLIQEREASYFGIRYRIPVIETHETILAVNVGGALIPVCISAYEIFRMFFRGSFIQVFLTLVAVAIVSIVCYMFAKPIRGVGIAIPLFIPPLIAVLVAIILSPHNATPVAYVAGTLGTLIGADIANLEKIKDMGAPMVSIGGAGTFDGVFLTGIVSLLLL